MYVYTQTHITYIHVHVHVHTSVEEALPVRTDQPSNERRTLLGIHEDHSIYMYMEGQERDINAIKIVQLIILLVNSISSSTLASQVVTEHQFVGGVNQER